MNNLRRVPREVDLVVGIPRSGLLVANLLALHLNIPMTDLDGLFEDRLLTSGKSRGDSVSIKHPSEAKVILIVDDSVYSGNEIMLARQRVDEASLSQRIVYAAVYVAPGKGENVDVFFEECPVPRMFEWNLMHSHQLRHACVDIDGVLCLDPTEQENDDGEAYCEFLSKAGPYLLPTKPIKALVTNRLEKYRSQTVDWLHRHHVIYDELIMRDLPDMATRRQRGDHGEFKAQVYREMDARIFIESSLKQSREIAKISLRPVISIETMSLVLPDTGVILRQAGQKLPAKLARRGMRAASGLKRILLRIGRD